MTKSKKTKTHAGKKPRMSASAARADGAAKLDRARKEAIAQADKNIAAIEKRESQQKGTKAKRLSGLDLAAKAVAASKEPLNAKTIAQKAIAAGWKTSGKTPHATLYAAIIREIADKGKDARFRKTDRGLFTAGPRKEGA